MVDKLKIEQADALQGVLSGQSVCFWKVSVKISRGKV